MYQEKADLIQFSDEESKSIATARYCLVEIDYTNNFVRDSTNVAIGHLVLVGGVDNRGFMVSIWSSDDSLFIAS